MGKKSFIKIFSIITTSLLFIALAKFSLFAETKSPISTKTEVATIGGGCFWSMEAMFQRLNGVISAEPGYAGGFVKNPSYEEVCTGQTGHAESINITFNPDKISYQKLVEMFFKLHNPTTLNQQGADEGTQYRSVIFYHNKKQKEIAEKAKADILKAGYWGRAPIVTEITPFTNFYQAEDYHKNYYNTHTNEGYCVAVIWPKLEKEKKLYKNLLK
jgi:peptide-methionine (S)-S-oxide reductase